MKLAGRLAASVWDLHRSPWEVEVLEEELCGHGDGSWGGWIPALDPPHCVDVVGCKHFGREKPNTMTEVTLSVMRSR